MLHGHTLNTYPMLHPNQQDTSVGISNTREASPYLPTFYSVACVSPSKCMSPDPCSTIDCLCWLLTTVDICSAFVQYIYLQIETGGRDGDSHITGGFVNTGTYIY